MSVPYFLRGDSKLTALEKAFEIWKEAERMKARSFGFKNKSIIFTATKLVGENGEEIRDEDNRLVCELKTNDPVSYVVNLVKMHPEIDANSVRGKFEKNEEGNRVFKMSFTLVGNSNPSDESFLITKPAGYLEDCFNNILTNCRKMCYYIAFGDKIFINNYADLKLRKVYQNKARNCCKWILLDLAHFVHEDKTIGNKLLNFAQMIDDERNLIKLWINGNKKLIAKAKKNNMWSPDPKVPVSEPNLEYYFELDKL